MTNGLNKKAELMGSSGLILAALLWGFSYPLTKYVETCPTFYIISIRFAIAAVALALIFFKHLKNINREALKYSFILSFIITAMYIFNIWGIKYTTSLRASFFTCLSFLIIPVINLMVYRIKLSRIIVISAAICLAGMFLLCYEPGLGGLKISFGDILCFIASIAGAICIIFIEKVSVKPAIDTTLFTVLLMAFVGIWGTVVALFTGEFSHAAPTGSQLLVIAIMGLFCSAAAFSLQVRFEKIVPSNRVGVIFALEPASGCILSVLLIHESMGLTSWVGAAVIMVSILYMEVANNRAMVKKHAASAITAEQEIENDL